MTTDIQRMQQVIINLMSNADKFTRKGQKMCIRDSPVWACILLFALGLFVTFGLYSTIGFGVLSLILGDEARHPGLLRDIVAEAGMLLAVLTSAVILLYFCLLYTSCRNG